MGKPISEELIRLLGDFINYSKILLKDDSINSELKIHLFRKTVKNIRALIKMSRYALGKKLYAETNIFFRDLNRIVSDQRDSSVFLDTLKAHTNNKRLTSFLATRLLHYKDSFYNQSRITGTFRDIQSILENSNAFLESFPKKIKKEKLYIKGVIKMYRQSQRAFLVSAKNPCKENNHEWRKKIKYLWHQLEFFYQFYPVEIEKLAQDLEQISNHLGIEHDIRALEFFLENNFHLSNSGKYALLFKKFAKVREYHFSIALQNGSSFYNTNNAFFQSLPKNLFNNKPGI